MTTEGSDAPPMTGRLGRVARRGGRLLLIYAGLIVLFVLAMWAVYKLPQGRIHMNVFRSEALLESEGLRPYVMLKHRAWRLDNSTDAQILDMALRTEPGGALVNSMANWKQTGPADPGSLSGNNITALKMSVDDRRDLPFSYARYWNGTLVMVRPALTVLTLADIRYVNMMVLSALALTVLLVLVRRAGSRAAVAFGLAAAWCGFLIVPMSIDFSNMAYLTLWAMLFMLVKAESDWLDRNGIEFFFVVGMLTAFFDLATTPTMSLGMPLALALVLAARQPSEHPWKSGALLTVKACVAWGVGYVASWLTKWIVATAVTGINVIRDAVTQSLFRTGAQDSKPLALDAIRLNLSDLVPMLRPRSVLPTALFLGILVVVAVGLFLAFRVPYSRIRQVLPVLFVVPLPYLWYAATPNLSSIHDWLAYRAQLPVVFAVIYVVASAIDFEALGRRVGLVRGDTASDGL